MDFTTLQKNLEELQYAVKVFDSKEDATEYLSDLLKNKTIGIGGSVTVSQMNLYKKLKERNTVFWHLQMQDGQDIMQVRQAASRADIYITSVNAISEKGEIVNIDNTGNRVAASSFGCQKVYFIIGENKITSDLESAIYRARNVAAPLNAQRLKRKTPCAVKGDRCYDCNSEDRICRNLSVFWKKPTGSDYEIILIKQPLGY